MQVKQQPNTAIPTCWIAKKVGVLGTAAYGRGIGEGKSRIAP